MPVNPRIKEKDFVPSFYSRLEPLRKRCPDCGLHVRGKNHADGDDHERGVARRAKS